MNTIAKGNIGEDKAGRYLEGIGFTVLFRKWRTKSGEIDIIAQKEDVLVFAEVKRLPSGNAETLGHELGRRKQGRIIETSKCFLSKYRQYNSAVVRYDVLVVDMPGYPDVYHIENAFWESV